MFRCIHISTMQKLLAIMYYVRSVPFVVGFFAVVYLSFISGETVNTTFSPDIRAMEHPLHTMMYACLTASAILAFGKTTFDFQLGINCGICMTILGAIIEILQATIPGVNRSCTMSDQLSNTLGSVIGIFLFFGFLFAFKKAQQYTLHKI